MMIIFNNLKTNKIMELTLEQALCILSNGWNEDTKELYNIANKIIKQEANRLCLIYQKNLIEEKLENFKNK